MEAFKIGSLIFLTLFLLSCEGGTTFTKVIKNDSSETVTVKLYQSVLSNNQTFNIGPKQKKTIFWTDNERRFVDETYECTAEIDSVELNVSNGKKLMKSMLDNKIGTRRAKAEEIRWRNVRLR